MITKQEWFTNDKTSVLFTFDKKNIVQIIQTKIITGFPDDTIWFPVIIFDEAIQIGYGKPAQRTWYEQNICRMYISSTYKSEYQNKTIIYQSPTNTIFSAMFFNNYLWGIQPHVHSQRYMIASKLPRNI
jgi:hypothetical protein